METRREFWQPSLEGELMAIHQNFRSNFQDRGYRRQYYVYSFSGDHLRLVVQWWVGNLRVRLLRIVIEVRILLSSLIS
jgi:hypothetical protein